MLRNLVADRKHRLEDGLVEIVADTADLARGSHIHAQDRIGVAQAGEGELRGFHADIRQFEGVDSGSLRVLAEHTAHGQVDEIQLQDFRHEGEATGGPQVALDDLHLPLVSQELDVERAGDVQLGGDGGGHAPDAGGGHAVEFLRRELDGGVTRVDAGIFDVLGDGMRHDPAGVGHGVEFELLAALDE